MGRGGWVGLGGVGWCGWGGEGGLGGVGWCGWGRVGGLVWVVLGGEGGVPWKTLWSHTSTDPGRMGTRWARARRGASTGWSPLPGGDIKREKGERGGGGLMVGCEGGLVRENKGGLRGKIESVLIAYIDRVCVVLVPGNIKKGTFCRIPACFSVKGSGWVRVR